MTMGTALPGLALLAVAAVVAAFAPLGRVRVIAGGFTLAGALALLGDAALRVVASGAVGSIAGNELAGAALGSGTLGGGSLSLLVGVPWSPFRLAVALACAASASLATVHALSYSATWDGKRRSRVLAACFALFIGSLYLVVLAEDYWTLIAAWEAMTLASAVLVGIDFERPDTRTALVWYLGIGQVSPVAFTLAVASAAPSSWSIDAIAGALAAASGPVQSFAFLALLAGAAAKAGLVPLHSWLPLAHPAAPSHVSAVMSGAMVTAGLLVFSRLAPVAAASAHPWWGWVALTLGVVSVFIGVINALVDGDLKRVLACSTIENMGLLAVELTLGLGLLGVPEGVERLALAAATLHVVAHALAKTGLFLSAGSLIHVSGTRLLSRMGGLLREAPVPSAAFIFCAASVAAIPPLAGFAGELMLLRALVGAAHELTGLAATAIALATAVLALGGALAVGAYARVIGIALLGSARSVTSASGAEVSEAHTHGGHAHPVGVAEKVAVVVPAIALVGAPVVAGVAALAGPLTGASSGVLSGVSPGVLSGALSSASGAPWGDALAALAELGSLDVVLVLLVLAALALTRGRIVRPTVVAPWVCGISTATSRMQYTADSFSQPVIRVFTALIQPSVRIDVDVHPSAEHAVRSRTYRRETGHIIEDALWRPLIAAFARAAGWGKRLQNGSISAYATWMLLGVLAVLLAARWL